MRHDTGQRRGVFLKDRHAGHMGQRLADEQIGVVERAGPVAEQAECTERGACGAHGQGVHGGEPGLARGGDEVRPAVGDGVQVSDGDGRAGAVAVDARSFVSLELEEFELAGLFGGGGQQAQLLQWIGEKHTGRGDVEQTGAALGELGEQVDDVEVVEKAVDEGDYRIEDSGPRGVSVTFPPVVIVIVQPQAAVQDVAGDVGGAATGGVGVGAKAHQGFGGIDLELGHEHPGGLADFGAGQGIEFRPGIAVGFVDRGEQVAVEDVEQRDAGDLGGGDGPGDVGVIKGANVRAEEVERADILAGDDDGHGEHGADVVAQQCGPEHGPAGFAGVCEVDGGDGGSLGDGVQAGALAEGELQLVVHARGLAAGAQRSGGRAVENQRDRSGVDVEIHHARLAEPVGGVYPTPSVNGGEELVVDRHI